MTKRPKVDTFAKLLVMLVVLHGMIMTTLSYVLSGLNCDPVQNVSVAIISEIIAPTVTFMITHVIQNIFEYNKLSFSTPLAHIEKTETDEADTTSSPMGG